MDWGVSSAQAVLAGSSFWTWAGLHLVIRHPWSQHLINPIFPIVNVPSALLEFLQNLLHSKLADGIPLFSHHLDWNLKQELIT